MTYALGRRLTGVAALIVALLGDASAQGSPLAASKPADQLSNCRQYPACAVMLDTPPPALLTALSDGDQVREAAFRTMIAMSEQLQIRSGTATFPGYHLAVEGYAPASEAIVNAVRARVPKAEALHARNSTGANGLTPDVERFALVSIHSVSIDGDHGTVRFGGFEYSTIVALDRTPSGWRPVGFIVTTIH